MKPNLASLVIVFLFHCLLFAGCSKYNDKKDFIGEWKLVRVEYMDSAVIMHGVYKPWMDFAENNHVTYDFQKNNKLVVTTFLSGELQKIEYSYQCVPYLVDSSSKLRKSDVYTHRLYIDGRCFLCILRNESLFVDFFSKTGGIFDEIDLLMGEQSDIYNWSKNFIKLK